MRWGDLAGRDLPLQPAGQARCELAEHRLGDRTLRVHEAETLLQVGSNLPSPALLCGERGLRLRQCVLELLLGEGPFAGGGFRR